MGKFLGTYMQTCIIKILGNNFQQQLQHPITKKADAEPKKSRSNKKSRCRTSLLKNGPTKLPCLLIILASWVDFFDIGLLLYPVPHHTLQCYTRKSFWVTRTGESKLFCIGFSLFWGRCRTWCKYHSTGTGCWLPWLKHIRQRNLKNVCFIKGPVENERSGSLLI